MDNFEEPSIVVLRVGKDFAIAGVQGEKLNKRELIHVLKRLFRIEDEEIAICLEEFKHNPHHRTAHFGLINKMFLFTN